VEEPASRQAAGGLAAWRSRPRRAAGGPEAWMSGWRGGADCARLQEEDLRRRLDRGEGEQEEDRRRRLDREQPVGAGGVEEVKLEDGRTVLAGEGDGRLSGSS
jgi:hypothetical protein